MKKALSEKNTELCKIKDCPAEAMNNTGFCPHHWNMEIEKREQERQKKREEYIKREKKIAKDPKLRQPREMEEQAYAWFKTNRWCIHCGHFCSDAEGHARLRKIQPRRPGPYDRRWEKLFATIAKRRGGNDKWQRQS